MSIETPPPPPPPPGPMAINQTFIAMEQGGDGCMTKTKLLDDIRNGVKLKKCETIEKGLLINNGHQVNGVAKVCLEFIFVYFFSTSRQMFYLYIHIYIYILKNRETGFLVFILFYCGSQCLFFSVCDSDYINPFLLFFFYLIEKKTAKNEQIFFALLWDANSNSKIFSH